MPNTKKSPVHHHSDDLHAGVLSVHLQPGQRGKCTGKTKVSKWHYKRQRIQLMAIQEFLQQKASKLVDKSTQTSSLPYADTSASVDTLHDQMSKLDIDTSQEFHLPEELFNEDLMEQF